MLTSHHYVHVIYALCACVCVVLCPAAYGKPLMLSSIDFTSDQGDALIGWGFMPQSVKKILYPKGYKGMFGK